MESAENHIDASAVAQCAQEAKIPMECETVDEKTALNAGDEKPNSAAHPNQTIDAIESNENVQCASQVQVGPTAAKSSVNATIVETPTPVEACVPDANEVAIATDTILQINQTLDVSTQLLPAEKPAIPKDVATVAAIDSNINLQKASLNESQVAESSEYQIAISTQALLQTEETIDISADVQPISIDLTNDKLSSTVVSSLDMLAAYNSDSDSNDAASVIEVPVAPVTSYYRDVVEINSNIDSDSSSDSDESAVELQRMRKALDKFVESDGDEDGDEEKGKKKKSAKVRGELTLDELPAIEDLQITVPAEECKQLGNVHSIVEQLVLVSALPNSMIVDLDTVLFLEKGKRVLGRVFDVLGQISEPLYCVRFNSQQHIAEKEIKVGDAVFMAPRTEHTHFVVLSNLMKMRGSDASWENDIEPPPHCLDYSDDEQEREARSRARRKNKQRQEQTNENADYSAEHQANNRNEASTSRYAQRRQHRQHGNFHADNNASRAVQTRHAPYDVQNQNHAVAVACSPNYNPSSWHSNYQYIYPVPRAAFAPPSYSPAAAAANMHTPLHYTAPPYAAMPAPYMYMRSPLPPPQATAPHAAYPYMNAHNTFVQPPPQPPGTS